MRKYLVLFITFVLVSTILINVFPNSGDGKVITKLGNPGNPLEKTITLEGNVAPLMDATTFIDVPYGKDNILPDSYFTISPVDAGDGNFAYNPTVDVGVDGDIEWTYDGVGYGNFGLQTVFSDDFSKKTLKYTAPGTNSQTKIKLPTEAQMIDARINVEGRLSTPTFQGTSLTLDTGFDQANYVAAGDINGDGSDDLVVTSKNTDSNKPDIVWYENPSPPGATEWKQHIVASNINYAFRIKLADLDNDSDLDIITSSYDDLNNYFTSGIYWFENKNSGSQWEGGDSGHQIDSSNVVQYPAHIEFGDLDNDGDYDIIAANKYWNNRYVYIFENKDPTNATTWKRSTVYSDTASTWAEIGGIAVGKINHTSKDRLDIAFSYQTYQGKIYWLENDGTPFSGGWNLKIVKDTVGTSAYERYPKWLAIADIDKDGFNDIVTAKEYSYDVYWYKNPSDPQNAKTPWWTQYSIYLGTEYPSDLVVEDINGDSHLDVLTTTAYYWSNRYRLHYLQNVSGSNSWTHSYIETSLAGLTGFAAANLDKGTDSDIDIIAAGMDAGEIKWYENDGASSPKFSIRLVDDAGISNPNDVEVMDVDDDGDNDFIVTGAKSGDVQWFEAPDNPYDKDWKAHNIDPSLEQAWQIALGDIDGDGDTDVAATSHVGTWWDYDGIVAWYEHPGSSSVKSVANWTKHVVEGNLRSPFGVDIADMDGDGDNDIVSVIEYSDQAKFYENKDGKGTSWTVHTIGTSLTRYPTGIKAADIDLDRDLDLVIGIGYDWGSTNGVLWLENPSNKSIATWTKHVVDKSIGSVQDIAVAKIDDNEYPDIIVTTKRYAYKAVYWYENPGKSGNSWEARAISSQIYFGGTFLHVADIGNDGYLDVIAGSGYTEYSTYGDNRLYWFEEPDEPLQASSWERYTVQSSINNPRGVFVADVDGTGIQDIVCVGAGFNEIWWNHVDMSYPRDVTLNIGGLGGVDFTYNGEVNVPRTTHNLALTFTEVLSDAATPTKTDSYGNEISEIVLEVNSPVVGRVGINTVDILYQYNAKVERNPHNDHLFNELNEIIPEEGSGTMAVNIAVTSQVPATMKISNMLISYNSPPTLESEIPSDRHVLEGESVNHLFDLYDYFTDDIDEPSELSYRIEQNSQAGNVWIFITDMHYIKALATKNDDWSGTVNVVVSATDTMGAKTYSNEFSIVVDDTNDPPTIGKSMPNFEIYEGQTELLLDMDDDDYFIDIDSDKLFYRAVIDEDYENFLRVDFDADNNMYATPIGDSHESNIPVHIYCDDSDISTVTADELLSSEIVQDIFVHIINVNDRPMWLNLPSEIQIEEDYRINHGKPYRWLNLNDFTNDVDNKEFELSYSVIRNTNSSYFAVTIDDQDWLHIDNALVENYIGKTFVTIRM
ncbi:MAG: VCBS repeat-containing protein, partial [Thermoplasmata archaeon]